MKREREQESSDEDPEKKKKKRKPRCKTASNKRKGEDALKESVHDSVIIVVLF